MKKKYFTFAALALALTACNKTDEIVPVDNLKDTPITVSAAVEGMLTRAGYETNKEDDTKSVLPEKFYLTVVQTEEATQYNYYNLEMTKTAGENKYTTTDNMLWKDATRNPFVSAYTVEGTDFTVQTDQSTAENVIASDLLGAIKESGETSADVTISGNNIEVDFRHLLCKLDVTYTWGSELTVETITSKSIKSVKYVGFGSKVTLYRETATVKPSDATADINACLGTVTVNVDETTSVTKDMSEAIFAPYVGEAAKIVITIETTTGEDDEAVTAERVFAINVKAPADGFVSGNRYTMNVTIGGTVAETGEIKMVKGWGDSITGDDMQTK